MKYSEYQKLVMDLFHDSEKVTDINGLLYYTIHVIDLASVSKASIEYNNKIIILKLFSFLKTLYTEEDLLRFLESRLYLLESNKADKTHSEYKYSLISELNLILAKKEKSFKIKTLFNYLNSVRLNNI